MQKLATSVIYINNTMTYFNQQSFHHPMIVVEEKDLNTGHLQELMTVYPDYYNYLKVVDNHSTDTSTIIQEIIYRLTCDAIDTIITIGDDLAIQYAKKYIYLSKRLINEVNKDTVIVIPEFILLADLKNTIIKKTPRKKWQHESIVPKVLLLNSTYHKEDPQEILIHKALNTLHRGIDLYLFQMMNQSTTHVILKCIQLIYTNIVTVYKRQESDAIQSLHCAISTMNLLFSKASVGLSHKIGCALGDHYHQDNSPLKFMLLPHTLSFLCQDVRLEKQVSTLAAVLGLDFDNPTLNVTAFVESLKMMNSALELPANISMIGLENGQVLDNIDTLAEISIEAINQLEYETPLSIEDIRGILVQVM